MCIASATMPTRNQSIDATAKNRPVFWVMFCVNNNRLIIGVSSATTSMKCLWPVVTNSLQNSVHRIFLPFRFAANAQTRSRWLVQTAQSERKRNEEKKNTSVSRCFDFNLDLCSAPLQIYCNLNYSCNHTRCVIKIEGHLLYGKRTAKEKLIKFMQRTVWNDYFPFLWVLFFFSAKLLSFSQAINHST